MTDTDEFDLRSTLAQSVDQVRQLLATHLQDGTPCEIVYEHNDEIVEWPSFVASIHSDFVVLGRLYQVSWINGWQALRLNSIVRVNPMDDADFILRAMKANLVSIPLPPPVESDCFIDFLRVVCKSFPIITTHDDPTLEHPSAAGTIVDVDADSITIKAMSTKGFWLAEPHRIELQHIAHVLFGSKYEQVLERIGKLPDSVADGDSAAG